MAIQLSSELQVLLIILQVQAGLIILSKLLVRPQVMLRQLYLIWEHAVVGWAFLALPALVLLAFLLDPVFAAAARRFRQSAQDPRAIPDLPST